MRLQLEKNFDFNNENSVEWLNGQKVITMTLCERKYINKMKKYSETHDECEIVKDNQDEIGRASWRETWWK